MVARTVTDRVIAFFIRRVTKRDTRPEHNIRPNKKKPIHKKMLFAAMEEKNRRTPWMGSFRRYKREPEIAN
jgi:hypothetical protein